MINDLNDGVAVAAFLEGELDKQIKAEELLGGWNLYALSRLVPSWNDEKDEASPGNKEKKKTKKTKTTLNLKGNLNNTHL